MKRVKTQEDFIKRAKEIHGCKYDYSKVNYVKSSVHVNVICPVHGVFKVTPNQHLRGDGCVACNKLRQRQLGLDNFLINANKIHGSRYDYSKVNYINANEKVEIICDIHGSFWQTPQCHISSKQNCPKCSAIAGGKKRRGKNNTAHKESTKRKKKETNLLRYGTKTWAESEQGRKKLHDIVTSKEVSSKMIKTCRERYGSDWWSSSDIGKQTLHEIMSSDEMKGRVKDGYIRNYGVDHFMKTDKGRKIARENILQPERQEALKQGIYKKYGVSSFLNSKYFNANRLNYLEKSWKTKRRNGTFNSSKSENTLKALLIDCFGKGNVECQYKSDLYPFYCDFYIKSLDLYIELNCHWTHGHHWFDETNVDDIARLNEWLEKAKSRGSKYYHLAIEVWTKRDVLKRETAIKNNLNYVVFWNKDLSDAREWLLNNGFM